MARISEDTQAPSREQRPFHLTRVFTLRLADGSAHRSRTVTGSSQHLLRTRMGSEIVSDEPETDSVLCVTAGAIVLVFALSFTLMVIGIAIGIVFA